jgi:hypothetical protein
VAYKARDRVFVGISFDHDDYGQTRIGALLREAADRISYALDLRGRSVVRHSLIAFSGCDSPRSAEPVAR